MLLEERLAASRGASSAQSIADASADLSSTRGAGLPDRRKLKERLSATTALLDFYIDGNFSASAPATAFGDKRSVRAVHWSTARSFGAGGDRARERFVDEAMYVVLVRSGQIERVEKIAGGALKELRGQADRAYESIADRKSQPAEIDLFRGIRQRYALPTTLTISPDKWLARLPIEYYIDADADRTVNVLTTGGDSRISELKLFGFFNPTLDLKGSEKEAEVISRLIPGSRVLKREAAKLSALSEAVNSNIVHLSMHGSYDSEVPGNSKLFFAGAKLDESRGDPHALYAGDLQRHAALRGRDVVFAAACQSGLTSSDRSNQSEILGLLRFLTANRNRNVILSLWAVDDAATQLLVEKFYEGLAKSMDVRQAFFSARAAVKVKHPHPYYWAAFYLSRSG